uniref:Nuclear VCP like n=1 Tax=Leptobrachium leishanense TaxID=445787 RepID=A0A8C5Q338_9ANUR
MSCYLLSFLRAEYGRRNQNAFRIQVEKVFKVICQENAERAGLEDEHVAKRARREEDDDDDDDDNDDEDNEDDTESFSEDSTDGDGSGSASESESAEQPSSNHMNDSLRSLYRKGNPDSASDTPSKPGNPNTSTPAPAKPKQPGAGSASGDAKKKEAGWFIDKTPGKAGEKNILIDLSKDAEEKKTAEPKQGSAAAPLLESEKKKPQIKKIQKGKPQSQAVDKEIKAALAKKVKGKVHELQQSTFSFQDVGGNDHTLKEICKMLIHMRHPEVYQHLGVVPPRGFLLHGPPGCGKTLLAQAIAGELDLPMLKVAATEMVSGVSGESEQKLRELFDQAVSSAPCILFIDEIDAITPKREVASKDMERRIVSQLLTCMDDLNSSAVTAQVLVIGATNRPDSLDPALRRAGRFDREICLGIPDEGARQRILQTLCREAATCAVNRVLVHMKEKGKQETLAMEQTSECAVPVHMKEKGKQETLAMEQTSECAVPEPQEDTNEPLQVFDELQSLLALLKSLDPLPEDVLQSLCIEFDDFLNALPSVQPSAKREGFATVPGVTWADIGALEEIREELTMAILAPVRNPEQFKALGLMAPAGVLLAGPPGCGKTLLAKAVANESGLNFISVKGPELLNMYVGESERAVRQVFQRAANSAPCVIFFDEIDALCPRRSGHDTGSSVRVVNQLLTEMDGLECRRQVFIMAATNRPDIIDSAILRPGRLDKTLYVGLPPPADRFAILQTITRLGTRPPLESDVSLEAIASDVRCDCFTGADLSALIREASLSALRRGILQQNPETGPEGIKVAQKHFEEAFGKVKPSVSKKDQQMYEALRKSLSR